MFPPRWLPEFSMGTRQEHGVPTEAMSPTRPLRADGGEELDDGDDAEQHDETGDTDAGPERSNVEFSEAGESEPANPKWEKPDPDDIPDFEVRADEPAATGATSDATPADQATDPTSGMPNSARSPGRSRITADGAEGYVAALELCARLPEDVRLPEEAADLVPAAVEAELENDVQQFAAAEFENPSPHVETLSFVETGNEIWLRLRLGVAPEAFADLDPDAIRSHALQQLEGLL